jgi:beta-N-acetylhexosaminidase
MKQDSSWFSQEQQSDENELESPIELQTLKAAGTTDTVEKKLVEPTEITRDAVVLEDVPAEKVDTVETRAKPDTDMSSGDGSLESLATEEASGIFATPTMTTNNPQEQDPTETGTPLRVAEIATTENSPLEPAPANLPQRAVLPPRQAILLIVFLLILVFKTTTVGPAQFIGAEGWAFVLGGPPTNEGDSNLLKKVDQQLRAQLTPNAAAQIIPHITPQEFIDSLVQNMTLDQRLGQMMIVQFLGPEYGLDISTMISQYNVGAVILFTVNNNIQDKTQLRSLIGQMQSKSTPIPLVVAIDQEGGTVDRLVHLDGARPSATAIGATNDPSKAMQEGIQDAKDLSSYGINLNLAPVVDVNNVYNPQLYLRTFGNNAALVTRMAEAYLQGLQQDGKVLGTLKHFPGLGDVSVDPHRSIPHLDRSKNDLEAIDWVPYRVLIQQGDVQAVMVTHEIVTAIDDSQPSSLSYKVVTGILRDELGFQGVIITDSLTMEGITTSYSEAQAAVLAIEAGSDLLMGAMTPGDVATMINGIKQAISAGEISQQRIDDSVRRILMLKYHLGLFRLPTIGYQNH